MLLKKNCQQHDGYKTLIKNITILALEHHKIYKYLGMELICPDNNKKRKMLKGKF